MQRRNNQMRPANSSCKSDETADHARPLNESSKKDAPKNARRLAELDWVPDLVVASDSERTRQTWARMEEAFTSKPQVAFTRRLYLASIGEVKSELTLAPSDVR